MVWITVTAIPNDENLDTPRCRMLLDTASIVCFGQRAGEHTQLWTTWDIDVPTLQIAESLDDIRAQIRDELRQNEEQRARAQVQARAQLKTSGVTA